MTARPAGERAARERSPPRKIARCAGFVFACCGAMLVVAQALYLFAPLLFASALSALVIKRDLLAFAKRPIDGGARLGGIRLFGDNKTWRGVIVAVVGCAVAAGALELAVGDVALAHGVAVVDHRGPASAVALGALMGLGAMIGELPNSFVKRRLGIAPGATTKRAALAVVFDVWDQVALLIGAWPCLALWIAPSFDLVLASFVLALLLHPLVSLIGYGLGARKTAR